MAAISLKQAMDNMDAAVSSRHGASGAELVAVGGRPFALLGAHLQVTAAAGLARTVLTQRFRNPTDSLLAVTYRMPLPEDGVVASYTFELDGRIVQGVVDTTQRAHQRFDEALAKGHTAAILDQNRSNIFTQEIGNVPPFAELVVRITVEQRLVWTASGEWEYRFPTVIGPRYLSGTQAAVVAAKRDVGIGVADGPLPFRIGLDAQIDDVLSEGAAVFSPSHALCTEGTAISLVDAARLDRDVILRWAVASQKVGAALAVARPPKGAPHANAAYGLLTLVPPSPNANIPSVARDLIVLLDTSGSMSGAPLEKAKAVVTALIEALGENDQLELIEFSGSPRRFQASPERASEMLKRRAIAWIKSLHASSSTEMYTAILEAMKSLRPHSQRQVVLITDGYIGGEAEVVKLLLERFPAQCRLHMVGVGSAVNGALLGPMARAGRGADIRLSESEDPAHAIHALSRRLNAPVLVDVTLSGSALVETVPSSLPDLFEGSPLLASVKLRPEGGTLIATGTTAAGPFSTSIHVAQTAFGAGNSAVTALFARECVADLETRWAIGQDVARIDQEVESIGLVFQIATRLTSFVAIDESTVHPTHGDHVEDAIPQELPAGMGDGSIAGLVATHRLFFERAASQEHVTRGGVFKNPVTGKAYTVQETMQLARVAQSLFDAGQRVPVNQGAPLTSTRSPQASATGSVQSMSVMAESGFGPLSTAPDFSGDVADFLRVPSRPRAALGASASAPRPRSSPRPAALAPTQGPTGESRSTGATAKQKAPESARSQSLPSTLGAPSAAPSPVLRKRVSPARVAAWLFALLVLMFVLYMLFKR